MNTAMALTTDKNACLSLRVAQMLFKIRASVHFAGNKMMKSKPSTPLTARASSYFTGHKLPLWLALLGSDDYAFFINPHWPVTRNKYKRNNSKSGL